MSRTITPNYPSQVTGTKPLARDQNATDASWLSEAAKGSQGKKNRALVVDEKKELRIIELPEGKEREEQLAGKHLIANVVTPNRLPDRIPVTKVTCHGDNFAADLPSDKEYDAVFWTEAAVEKFLYPYYHAQRLWDKKMENLKREFEQDRTAVAVAHRAPSTSEKVASVVVGVVNERGELNWMTIDDYLIAAAKSRSSGSRAK